MKKKLVILGAGGHGRVCAETARFSGYEDVLFLDDGREDDPSVSGKIADFGRYLPECDFFVAIGNNLTRQKIFDAVKSAGGSLATLIHPKSFVSENASVGEGSAVMAGAVINTGAVIRRGVIVNTSSAVDHDCVVGDFCHVSVGASVAGTVVLGERTFVCAGATVINNIEVCEDCILAAGCTVIDDITESGTYAGTPAVRIK